MFRFELNSIFLKFILTHGLELADQLLLGPLLFVAPKCDTWRNHGHFVIIRIWDIEVVHQNNVRILHGKDEQCAPRI